MCGETRPDRRDCVPLCPFENARQRSPIWFLPQAWCARFRSGDDQCIESAVTQLIQAAISLAQLPASSLPSRYVGQVKKPKLDRDIAGCAIEKLKKLPLRRLQCCIGHVVDEPDNKRSAWRLQPLRARPGRPLPSRRWKCGKTAGRNPYRHESSPGLFRRQHGPPAGGRIQCLVEVRDDVVDVLDADAQANHFRPHTRLGLLLGRHLTVGS
jgi:hypothetical protein